MTEPQFSLCYTSRRPAQIPEVVKLWLSRKVCPEQVEVIVSVDADDLESMALVGKIEGVDRWAVQEDLPGNCVKGWNAAAAVSSGRVIIAIADDFIPPEAWDKSLLDIKIAHQSHWTEHEAVVHVDDGYNKLIATLAIVTRIRYDRLGYLFYPGYESMFSDTELTEHAIQDRVMIDARHLMFEHIHYACRKRGEDSVDKVHGSSARWARGEMLFNWRKSQGFPVDLGPKADLQKKTVLKSDKLINTFVAYIQAVKDDFCLLEVCERLIDEGVQNFYFSVPDEYWSGKTTPEADIQQLRDIASELIAKHVSVQFDIENVAQYREGSKSRIEVETKLRNHAIKVMSRRFRHILIVDGDELWVPGFLKTLDEFILTDNPVAVACGGIPVIGLPGYPINDAKDKITIYIRSDASFKECRSVDGPLHTLAPVGVIHFTATRKTMDEIAEKHRQSGHYDDPDYAMEEWITDVLPTVLPGSTNVHMYRKFQIWPLVRNWSMHELSWIPKRLHPYLGTKQYTPRKSSKVKARSYAAVNSKSQRVDA